MNKSVIAQALSLAVNDERSAGDEDRGLCKEEEGTCVVLSKGQSGGSQERGHGFSEGGRVRLL